MSSVTLALGFGLVTASMLALSAVAFTLQFAVADIFNLAFGEVMTVSAFAGYGVWVSAHTNLLLALLAGAVAGAAASLLLNVAVFEPFKRRGSSRFVMVMVTLGMSQVLINVLQIIFGTDSYNYPSQLKGSVQLLGMSFTGRQITIIVVAVVLLAGLQISFRGTRLGKAIRATASDGELASVCGISVRRIIRLTWLISGALCGVAGVAFASSIAAFDISIGSGFFFVVVAAAVFGGVGQPSAAIAGALIIGVVSELAAIVDPVLRDVVAFLALVIVLLLRPAGLFTSGRVALEQPSA